MSTDNDRTLKTYNDNSSAYIDDQEPELSEHLKKFILSALAHTPAPGRILEIGSAAGRDADWIEDQGYTVQRTDAAKSFVDYMKAHNHDAHLLNVLKDDLGGPYDLIYASAVLLHFTREETALVLRKVLTALDNDGIFAVRMKLGDKAEWTNEKMGAPRYMVYWDQNKFEHELNDAGYAILATSFGEHRGNNWIMVLATKATSDGALDAMPMGKEINL